MQLQTNANIILFFSIQNNTLSIIACGNYVHSYDVFFLQIYRHILSAFQSTVGHTNLFKKNFLLISLTVIEVLLPKNVLILRLSF